MKLKNFLFLIFVYGTLGAQTINGDLSLLQKERQPEGSIQSKKQHLRNPFALGYLFGIKVYQHAISEQIASDCAFELTCSRFSKAMVQDYGFVKGYFLTFDRLSRCTKISAMETYPDRLTTQGKIIETPADFHFR